MKKGEWVTSVGRWERGPNTLGDREKNPAHRRHRAGWFHRSPTGTSLTLPDDSYRMVTVWLLASNSPSDRKKPTHQRDGWVILLVSVEGANIKTPQHNYPVRHKRMY